MRYSTAVGISVDARGNAWITGGNPSSDLQVTSGAQQTTPGGSFLLELNAAGSQVLYASYFGNGAGYATSQALDRNGNLYLTGYASSAAFPVTTGAFQTDPGELIAIPGSSGPQVPFVSKIGPTGKLVYSTFFHGGNGSTTTVGSIAVDSAGSVYLTGGTSGGSFPTTAGAFQTTASAYPGYVAKFDPTGSTLVYCTYLSANTPLYGTAIAVDSQNDAYVTGVIRPNADQQASTFPVTAGAFQTTAPVSPLQWNPQFGFVTKLNAAGSAPVYSTLLYASNQVTPNGLAVDAAGSAIVLGTTSALDFPTTPGALFQCYPNGTFDTTDAFLFKLSADGSHALYSTYLGTDVPTPVALDSAGDIYVAGENSGVLPLVPGSFGWTDDSGSVMAKIAPQPLASGTIGCIASAANRSAVAIAPGEIVSILGNGIGPAQPVSASAASGQMPTSLDGIQVLLYGTPAPLLSAGPNEITAVVPFEVAPADLSVNSFAAEVQILNPSVAVQPATVTIAPAAPAIYTVGEATGQALMINQDGTPNSAQNPALQGSIVTIYATGLNNTAPPLATGAIASAAAPLAFASQLGVGLSGDEILYAGAAPGFVAGLTQINFQIPVKTSGGFTALELFLRDGPTSQLAYFYQQ